MRFMHVPYFRRMLDALRDHFRIVFQSDKKTAFITFDGQRTETGCRFSHTEAFGMTTPVIGPIMNFLIFKVFFRKMANWQLIRDDMILDNRYLTEILTEEKYPDRIKICSLYEENDDFQTEGFDGIKLCACKLKEQDLTKHFAVFEAAEKKGK